MKDLVKVEFLWHIGIKGCWRKLQIHCWFFKVKWFMVQRRFVEKEDGSWILCCFIFLFTFFLNLFFQFSFSSFHKIFKAKDASSSSGRQTCEICLIFILFYRCIQMGYLWLNLDLNFSVLTFRFLPCQTPSESYFSSVWGVWWKARNERISLKWKGIYCSV